MTRSFTRRAGALAMIGLAAATVVACSPPSDDDDSTPAASGSSGAVDAKTATSAEAFGGMDALVAAANKEGALSRVLETGAANLEGNGENLNAMNRSLSQAVQTFAEGRGDLFATVKNLETFTGMLAANDAQVRRLNADLSLVSDQLDVIGDVPTQEALAAAELLHQHVPDLRFRFVNVVDLMALLPEGDHPHGYTDSQFDDLFTADRHVVFVELPKTSTGKIQKFKLRELAKNV